MSFKNPEDHDAAMEKLDEIVTAIDEPRGSCCKVARRLHASIKNANSSSNGDVSSV